MNHRFVLNLFVAGAIVSGCSSTQCLPYEGGAIVIGHGGTRETVEGMDIWRDGDPPRAYRVVAIIDDTRRRSLIGMANYRSDLIKAAKNAGGDAIVIVDHQSEAAGIDLNSGVISHRNFTKAEVVKYAGQ